MAKFAANTTVNRAQSLDEIERILRRYRASGFAYGWEGNQAMVQFQAEGRRIRLMVQMPDRNDKAFTHTPARGTARKPPAAEKEWDQACRQRWRALALVIKAKLEAIDSGITTFDEEFGMAIVLPNGRTVAQEVLPGVRRAYETDVMQPLLPAPEGN